MSSLFDSLSAEQKAELDAFTQGVYAERILDDIYKLIITRQVFTRFLVAADFDQAAAKAALKDYIVWRRRFQVDMLLDHDFMGKEDVIREFMPTGFHEVDRAGRPILFVNAGQIKLNELMAQTNPETITKFIIKELEHTWREKFDIVQTKMRVNVDQFRLVVDLKGAKLKQITNKQLNLIWKEISKELSKRFPEIVHSITVVNTPMFFENFYNNEILPTLSARTASKVLITGESAPQSLLEAVEPERLPQIYGGQCSCSAQCIYSDKGPWSDILNVIDFQNRQYTTTEAEFHENVQAREEFKLLDYNSDDDDPLGGGSDIARLKAAFSKRKSTNFSAIEP